MEKKYDIKLLYDYNKIKNSAIILTVAGVIEILVSLIIDKIHFMAIGVLIIFASSQNLKTVTKEEMELKSLTINSYGVSIESNNGTKIIKWQNIKSVREYTPTTSKQLLPSVEIVADTEESINFSYKNFVKVRKIRKSLKYFSDIYKVEIEIK